MCDSSVCLENIIFHYFNINNINEDSSPFHNLYTYSNNNLLFITLLEKHLLL